VKLKRLLIIPTALILVAIILVLGASAVTYFRARRLFAAAASLKIGDTEQHARQVIESIGGDTNNACFWMDKSWVCDFSADTGQEPFNRFLFYRAASSDIEERKRLVRFYLRAMRGARMNVHTENGGVVAVGTELTSVVSWAVGVVTAEPVSKQNECESSYRTRPRPNSLEDHLRIASDEATTIVPSSAPPEMQKKALLMNASCATYIRNCSAKQMLSLQCPQE
jgi:hypothetical protein